MQRNIRNFSIIAHIDHGKSTLADRILEFTGAVNKRDMKQQILDSMDLEREKGITIKSQAVTFKYVSKGEEYIMNLIDTPGHVDFTYEVSRSLSACEGALLVVDATQGVEAQTIANVYLALENNLEILPVINKIDLPNSDVERTKKDIEELGISAHNAVLTSAKTGFGIEDLLESIVEFIPAPKDLSDKPLKALIFDSHYDDYRGIIVYVKVVEGTLRKADKILFFSTQKKYDVLEVGIFTPKMVIKDSLSSGEVGYIIAGIKTIKESKSGDTIVSALHPLSEPLKGYKEIKPMVFAGIYPIDSEDYEDLKDAMAKIQLNDPSLVFEGESSDALGLGLRVGFLGLLHMEIIVERLKREYNLSLISSTPSVVYKIKMDTGEQKEIGNPSNFPPRMRSIFEPIVVANIAIPSDFVGDVMQLCEKKRATFKNMKYTNNAKVILTYDLPLSEMLVDFYDKLKSCTKGYSSFEYEFKDYQEADLVKMDILLNGESIDALSIIVHRDHAHYRGKNLVEKLSEVIPKHMFDIPIQAAIGGKVIARETIKAMRKNVLSKCYGGDISRKRKLLEKQKEGKKKMKSVGNVSIPQEAFLQILKID